MDVPHNPIRQLDDVVEYIVTATCYQPVPEQTNSDPGTTADMSKINLSNPLSHRWCAVSRDIYREIGFGAVIEVSGTGYYDGEWTVHDLMNRKHKNRVDFLVGVSDPLGKWEDVNVKVLKYGKVKK